MLLSILFIHVQWERFKLKSYPLFISLLVVLAVFPGHAATARPLHRLDPPLTLYIVRHAEKLNDRDDSPLTARGERYAEGLAQTLKASRITRVLASPIPRAQATARPTLRILQLRRPGAHLEVLPSDRVPDIQRVIRRLRKYDRALLVGRSSFIPELVLSLSGRDISRERDRYYRIYRLVRRQHGKYGFVFYPGPVWKQPFSKYNMQRRIRMHSVAKKPMGHS